MGLKGAKGMGKAHGVIIYSPAFYFTAIKITHIEVTDNWYILFAEPKIHQSDKCYAKVITYEKIT